MEIWNGTEWYVQLVFNVLLLILPTLIGLAIVNASGAKLVDTVRMLLNAIRPAIDEPGDPLIVLIAAKTGRKAEDVSDLLVGKVDEVIALLPGEPPVPPVEAIPQQENIASVVTAYYPPTEGVK